MCSCFFSSSAWKLVWLSSTASVVFAKWLWSCTSAACCLFYTASDLWQTAVGCWDSETQGPSCCWNHRNCLGLDFVKESSFLLFPFCHLIVFFLSFFLKTTFQATTFRFLAQLFCLFLYRNPFPVSVIIDMVWKNFRLSELVSQSSPLTLCVSLFIHRKTVF